MTYYGGRELAAAFRTVRRNTIGMAGEIPEEKYGFRPAPDCRSVAHTLAHIALLTRFSTHVHGTGVTDLATIDFPAFMQAAAAEEAKPRTKAELLALLKTEGDLFAAFLEGCSEAFLAERVAMPPGAEPASKSRFEMLMSAKEHEMHHRGQLMTAQRMLGLVPHLTRQAQERFAARAAAAQAQAGR
ncbi:MAG: DinB family protein [Acidobacteria bacterium]|nr:DinB family protein [Acidobacteriota bacterium]